MSGAEAIVAVSLTIYAAWAVILSPAIVLTAFDEPKFAWQRRVPNFVTLLCGLAMCVAWLPLVLWAFRGEVKAAAVWLVSKPRAEDAK